MLTSSGVMSSCWLSPHEPLGPHDGSEWRHGGFAYIFADGEAELDCVYALKECKEHVPIARLPQQPQRARP